MISPVRVQHSSVDSVIDNPRRTEPLQVPTIDQRGHARIVIASPQPIMRHGIRALLTVEVGLEVVAEAEDGAAAVALARQFRPDVVLLDVQVPRLDVITATRLIRSEATNTTVVVMASVHDDALAIEAIRAGASAYLQREARTDAVLRTIRDASTGQIALPSHLAVRLLRVVERSEEISDREGQVLRLVARGKANKLIARELHIAESTVKSHIGSILNKLGLDSRTQLALYATRNWLVAPERMEQARES